MMIRSIALLAMCVPIGLHAASSRAPLAIYYSFDAPPSAALVTEMQAEVDRILDDGGVRVAWRGQELRRKGEDFPEIVFLRFRGFCSWSESPAGNDGGDPVGQPLAESDVAGGRVLPFGSVNCDRVRRYIAPALKSLGTAEKNAELGRAVARVSAHEIYHMLTSSPEHARRGIARASHSRADLTAPTFSFAEPQRNWLRAWAARTVSPPAVSAEGVRADPDPVESTGYSAGASAGR